MSFFITVTNYMLVFDTLGHMYKHLNVGYIIVLRWKVVGL